MPSPRRFRDQSRSQKRLTSWASGPDTSQDTISATGDTGWEFGTALDTESRATLVRTRGTILLTLSTGGGAGDGYIGSVGIGIVTLDAFTAGVIPGPSQDPDWPGWLFHQEFAIVEGAAGISNGSAFQRIDVDSKAMRKIGENEILFGSTDVVELGAGAIMQVTALTRMLFKLT